MRGVIFFLIIMLSGCGSIHKHEKSRLVIKKNCATLERYMYNMEDNDTSRWEDEEMLAEQLEAWIKLEAMLNK